MAKPCARMASTERGATLGMSITLTKMLALLALASRARSSGPGTQGASTCGCLSTAANMMGN